MTAGDNDRRLVEQALAGDKTAFGKLVERHRPVAVRLACRMLNDWAEADDVAQEACLHAFLALDRLRDLERFGPWLSGITVNLSRMRLRARRAMCALEDWDGGHVAQGFAWSEVQPSAEAAYEIRELHVIVLNAIALLPPELQAVVRLHYLDGLTLTEIGVLAGAPLGTVKARLHRARERLRAELGRELAGPGPASHRKEKAKMIEVMVQEVIMRVAKPVDVLEAAGREQPGPETPDVRIPLPPPPTAGQGVFMLKGDEQRAQVFNLPAPPPAVHRVVLLKEKNGERILPIWIGPHEADMIALQLVEKSTPRPMAYELTARLLEAAHATIERVAVSQLKDDVFYATLWMRAGGATHEIDARPSDALNLALRLNVPIFVAPEVMDQCAVLPDKLTAKLSEHEMDTFQWVSAPAPNVDLPKRSPEK